MFDSPPSPAAPPHDLVKALLRQALVDNGGLSAPLAVHRLSISFPTASDTSTSETYLNAGIQTCAPTPVTRVSVGTHAELNAILRERTSERGNRQKTKPPEERSGAMFHEAKSMREEERVCLETDASFASTLTKEEWRKLIVASREARMTLELLEPKDDGRSLQRALSALVDFPHKVMVSCQTVPGAIAEKAEMARIAGRSDDEVSTSEGSVSLVTEGWGPHVRNLSDDPPSEICSIGNSSSFSQPCLHQPCFPSIEPGKSRFGFPEPAPPFTEAGEAGLSLFSSSIDGAKTMLPPPNHLAMENVLRAPVFLSSKPTGGLLFEGPLEAAYYLLRASHVSPPALAQVANASHFHLKTPLRLPPPFASQRPKRIASTAESSALTTCMVVCFDLLDKLRKSKGNLKEEGTHLESAPLAPSHYSRAGHSESTFIDVHNCSRDEIENQSRNPSRSIAGGSIREEQSEEVLVGLFDDAVGEADRKIHGRGNVRERDTEQTAVRFGSSSVVADEKAQDENFCTKQRLEGDDRDCGDQAAVRESPSKRRKVLTRTERYLARSSGKHVNQNTMPFPPASVPMEESVLAAAGSVGGSTGKQNVQDQFAVGKREETEVKRKGRAEREGTEGGKGREGREGRECDGAAANRNSGSQTTGHRRQVHLENVTDCPVCERKGQSIHSSKYDAKGMTYQYYYCRNLDCVKGRSTNRYIGWARRWRWEAGTRNRATSRPPPISNSNSNNPNINHSTSTAATANANANANATATRALE